MVDAKQRTGAQRPIAAMTINLTSVFEPITVVGLLAGAA